MDVVDGPLQRARENIAEHHLEKEIETRKSDGLTALRPGEADAAVIAGMGGLLICRILEQGREVAATIRDWVLEPQSDTARVRSYLLNHGYTICEEEIVEEDGKFYPVMRVRTGKEENGEADNQEPYRPEELLYGRYLLRNRHPVLRKYLEKEIRTYRKLLENLAFASGDRARVREKEITEALEMAEQAFQIVNG